MPCAITAINSNAACAQDQGGIVRSFFCNLTDITAVSNTAGVVTGLTMVSTGLLKLMQYSKDDTAYMNQTGARENERLSVTATAFFKFRGVTAAYIKNANEIGECCSVVAIHIFANGARIIQGIELDATAVGGFVGTRKVTQVTPSILSDTGANQSRLEYMVEGSSNTFAPSTTLTDAALIAL